MPVYYYKCSQCGCEQTQTLSMDKRKDPESQPCPQCEELEVKIQIKAPRIVTGVGSGPRVTDGFKENMSRIKETHKIHSPKVDEWSK